MPTMDGRARGPGAGWTIVRAKRHGFWTLITRMVALFLILGVYSWFRKMYFQPDPSVAFANALDIIRWQDRLGLNIELDLQRRVIDDPFLVDLFNEHYRKFKIVLFAAAALALLRDRAGFTRVWRLFLVTTAIAFPMYALYPLAPPRFMGPYGFPFVDTLAVLGSEPNATSGLHAANQFAAMPSMHIGWTVITALWMVVALPRWRLGTVLGAIHLSVMCVTVMVTGNHFVLDIVGGFAVVGVAWVALALPGWFASPGDAPAVTELPVPGGVALATVTTPPTPATPVAPAGGIVSIGPVVSERMAEPYAPAATLSIGAGGRRPDAGPRRPR